MEKKIIHFEGFIVLIATIYIYALNEFSWLIFLLLLLVPDVSMLAYFINNHIGAQVYNLFHTYIVSIFLILIGVFLKSDVTLMIGLI